MKLIKIVGMPNRSIEIVREVCPLCEEEYSEYATYPWNRSGSFEEWWHSFCIEKAARWFREQGHRIDWKTGKLVIKK